MNTQILYKRANVSREDAFAALYKSYPGARLVDFETKKATRETAKAASVKVGELIYEATIKLAEFPPSDGGGEEEAPEPKEPKEDSGDEGGDDDAPSFDDKADGGDEGGLGEPKKMKPEEQMVHLLTQILDAIKGPGLGDDMGGPPGLGAGAPPPPPAKAPMGAPKPGGPPMGGGPMPPKPPMPGGAFSHYDPNQREIVTIRRSANEKGNKALIAEAAEAFPTHKVAKIQRTGEAILNDKRYNLPKNNIAVVTLIKG